MQERTISSHRTVAKKSQGNIEKTFGDFLPPIPRIPFLARAPLSAE